MLPGHTVFTYAYIVAIFLVRRLVTFTVTSTIFFTVRAQRTAILGRWFFAFVFLCFLGSSCTLMYRHNQIINK